jgi:hypothetical protein
MNSVEDYNLKDFRLVTYEPYVYRLFINDQNIFLLEVTCGMHGIWNIWIRLTEEEILKYKSEKKSGLKEIAGLFSYNCYDEEYKRRYVNVIQ